MRDVSNACRFLLFPGKPAGNHFTIWEDYPVFAFAILPVKDLFRVTRHRFPIVCYHENKVSIEVIAKSLKLSEEKVKEIINSKVPVNA